MGQKACRSWFTASASSGRTCGGCYLRVQDLQGASAADLAVIEVDGAGFNLHWPALEVDLYVPTLVAGIFGTRAWMTRELARAAGQAKSPAKAAASRSNGHKGGRPRKTAGG